MARRKWTSGEVLDALRSAYGVAGSTLVTDEWAFLTEVPLRTGVGKWAGNERRIDLMLVRCWSSGIGHRRLAVEVKVSRADFRNETDLKRAPAEHSAHHTYYAAPVGIIPVEDLPAGWGLREVYPDMEAYRAGRGWEVGVYGTGALVRCRRRPADRTPGCDLNYLVSAYARRASRAEERIRRGDDDASAVVGLRADVERLTGQLERRDDAILRERQRVVALREVTAAMEGGHVCADCEQPIGLDTRNRYAGATWKHRSAADHDACMAARAEADRAGKEARFGTRYSRGWAAPVEPKALREQAAGLPDKADY